MRFLLRMVPSDPDLDAATRVVRGVASTMGGKAVNAKRTSYGALEIDVFLGSREDFEVFVAAVEPLGRVEFSKDLQEAPPFLTRDEALAEAVSLFDAERFWEAHEVLESQWRVAHGEEKRLLQGLILVCAAFVHEQKGEQGVALGVAKRALPLLSWPEARYHGISISVARDNLVSMVATGSLSLIKL